MNNAGSKISFVGLMLCALITGIRVLTNFGAIITRDDDIIYMTYTYLNYAFLIGLAVILIGFVLKFLGSKDIFDLIVCVCVLASIAVTFIPMLVFYGSLIGNIIGSVLDELFLLGIGINLFKKGKQAPGIVLSLMFMYFAVLYPVAVYVVFGGGIGGIIRYLINIFNGALSVVTLGLAAVSVVNDD